MPQWRSGRVQVPRHSVALRSSTLGMLSLDLSMHAAFKGELRVALGGVGGGCLPPLLPQVFADGRHLGGAEVVCRLHEARELVSALDACDAVPCTTKKIVGCSARHREQGYGILPMQNLGNPRQRGSGWVASKLIWNGVGWK